jgi:hypothetical protein
VQLHPHSALAAMSQSVEAPVVAAEAAVVATETTPVVAAKAAEAPVVARPVGNGRGEAA